jgi:hypothetical protein
MIIIIFDIILKNVFVYFDFKNDGQSIGRLVVEVNLKTLFFFKS